MKLKPVIQKVKDLIRSQRGHNILVFFVFLLISATLWCLLSLNEEDQFDVRMPLRITNIPDSVTVITTPPANISVSLRTRGTQILKHFGSAPAFDIDFRVYRSRNSLLLSNTDIKAIARAAYGGANILAASPDSINLAFTSRRGTPMPIVIDYRVTAGPQSTIAGRPTLSFDSTLVFTTSGRLSSRLNAISTEPIRLTDLNRPTTLRVRLIAPRNSRVIPDSVDVTFNVEPLISKTRKIVIEPVNVPKGVKLITFPAQIEVFYMVPMSLYNDSDPHFRVYADYNSITGSHTHKIKLRLRDVPSELQNVHLSADSAEYIIERK